MREIKFRAWNGEKMLTERFLFDHAHYADFSNSWHWMQYTGLKDKSGLEIFEGDIVRVLYTDWPSNTDPNIPLEDYLISISHIGTVEYEAPEFGIRMVKENRYGEKPLCSFNYGTHGRIEIIGNIYQNPELC